MDGQTKVTASLSGSGSLGAHLNIRNEDGAIGQPTLKLIAYDYSETPDTIVSEWPSMDLFIGQTIALTVLEQGPADPPHTRRRTSENPGGLFASPELAARVCTEAQDLRNRLLALVQEADASEPAEEAKAFKHAVGSVVYKILERVLSPIWRRHQHLIPEDYQGQPL